MRDSTERFSDRVADYARYRPSYPEGLVPAIREAVGLTPAWVVADLGSGTGLSSRPFLEHGNPVVGVEPNEGMRGAAEASLAGFPAFRSVGGTAESTGLGDGSVDLVVAGQAFHWFDPAAAREESARILRDPGWAALFWNMRLSDADAFARGYESLLERHGTDYGRVRSRWADRPAIEAFFGGRPEERRMPNEQVFDFEGLRGRLLSSSYAPAPGHPSHEPMMEELRRLFDEHAVDGTVRFAYETELFLGRLSPGAA